MPRSNPDVTYLVVATARIEAGTPQEAVNMFDHWLSSEYHAMRVTEATPEKEADLRGILDAYTPLRVEDPTVEGKTT
jgi:hypothetical protein